MTKKEEVVQQIRQDSTQIYGKPIFYAFLELAKISLETYLELDEKEKELVKNVDQVLSRAAHTEAIGVIKDVTERKKLGPDSVWYLFQGSQDPAFIKAVISLLIQKQDLDPKSVMWILVNAKQNLEEVVKELGSKNIDKLDDKNFQLVMQEAAYDGSHEQMVKLLINYKTNITSTNLYHIFHHTNQSLIEELTKLIIEKKKDLNSDDIWNLIRYNIEYENPKDKQIENVFNLLGTENIDKLNHKEIENLVGMVRRKKSAFDMVFSMLLKYKTELSDENIEDLISGAESAASNLTMNLQPNYPDDVIERIIEKKKILSTNNIYYMLWVARDKEKIVNLIGIDNIRKMPKPELEELLQQKGSELKNILN